MNDDIRNFIKQLSRGGVKSIPITGAFLEQVIYGTLDEKAAQEQSEKLHSALAQIKNELQGRDVSFDSILDDLAKQDAFRDEIKGEIAQLKQLLKDPEKTIISPAVQNAAQTALSAGPETVDIINKLARMHPSDLGSVIASFPEAQPYIPAHAGARQQANELVIWANKQTPSRIPEIIETAKRINSNFRQARR